jgi:hypothetical protein
MRYNNRYAMPVHPKVLEKDYKSDSLINSILEIEFILKDRTDFEPNEISYLNETLHNLWYRINHKQGINLRDREKLLTVFQELSRIFGGSKNVPVAYRGTRLSRFDPNALSRTFPYTMEHPEVIEHLENLAYGLRSWSQKPKSAYRWAKGSSDGDTRDRVVFKVLNTEVVLDANPVNKFFNDNLDYDTGYLSVFDNNEVILYMRNPKVISIEKTFDNIWEVEVK